LCLAKSRQLRFHGRRTHLSRNLLALSLISNFIFASQKFYKCDSRTYAMCAWWYTFAAY